MARDQIECCSCFKVYTWEEPKEYTGTEYMPDGYFIPEGKWICDRCGSCPECGRTLEKEPKKRGPKAKLCKYCEPVGQK